MKRLLLALAFSTLAFSQGIVNLNSPPPPPVPSVGITQTGVLGSSVYYYQIITRYAAGAVYNAPTQLLTSNGTLTGGNFNTLNWGANPGAVGYDVLRFTTNTGYAGTCTCLVGSTTTATTINDQSNTVTSYTLPSGASAATAQIYINTRDHVTPELRYVQNGIDQPLGNTISSSQVVPYTSGVGGTTTHTLVKISAGTVVAALTTDIGPGVVVGVAKDTTLATQSVDVATSGNSLCVIDAGNVVAGNLVGVSTTVAGDCKDLGTAIVNAVPSNLAIIGRAITAATSGNTTNIALMLGEGGVSAADCGVAAGACANTNRALKIVTGEAVLTTGSPSTAAITGMPAFTSTTSYQCFAQDTTTVAVNIGVLTAGYVSTTAVTFTGPNTNTDTFRFSCIGY